MKGRQLREVQELLGHKSLYMTQRYSHLAPERLRDAVASMDSTTSDHTAPPNRRKEPSLLASATSS